MEVPLHKVFELGFAELIGSFYSFEFAGKGLVVFELIFELMLGGSRPKNDNFIRVAQSLDDLAGKGLHLIVTALFVLLLIHDAEVLIGIGAAMDVGFYFGLHPVDAHLGHFIGFNNGGVSVVDPNSIIGVHE